MSTLDLHAASVPVFRRYLGQLDGLLVRAQAHVAQARIDERLLLQARLSPTMHPFATQVAIAAGFALRACAPLAGLAVPDRGPPEDSLAGLRTRVAQARAFVESIDPAQMHGREAQRFRSQAGQEAVELPAAEFLLQYAMPNFFFHLTTAYAILRHLGVGVGKADFDGYHVYDAA